MGGIRKPDTNLLTVSGVLKRYRHESARTMKHQATYGVAASIIVLVVGLLANSNADYVLISAVLCLLAVAPITPTILEAVARFAYRQKRARISSLQTLRNTFQVEYEAKEGVVLHKGKPLKKSELDELRIFLAACASVSTTSHLPVDIHHPTTEYVRHLHDNLTVSVREYGSRKQLYAFVYGKLERVLDYSKDIWELGHVRSLKPADITTLRKQDKKTTAEPRLAFGFMSLPKNYDTSTFNDFTFLGSAAFETPKEHYKNLESSISTNLNIGTQIASVSQASLLGLSILSFLGVLFLGTPPLIAVLHVLVYKLFIEAPLVASAVWDNKKNKHSDYPLTQLLWLGGFITIAATSTAWAHATRSGIALSDIRFGTALYAQIAMTVLLTFSLCLFGLTVLLRRGALRNVFFGISCSLSLLMLASFMYVSSIGNAFGLMSLRSSDLLYSITAAGLCTAAAYVYRYAHHHHSRSSVLALLR